MPYRVLNLAEASDYLHVTREDLERLVHYREVPFERQGQRLVFRKRDLDAWASRRILALPHARLHEYHHGSTRRVRRHRLGQTDAMVTELLQACAVAPALRSRTRAAVLRDMAALGAATGLVTAPEELLAELQEREALCSTALPGGYALLHPRHHDPYLFVDSFLAIGRAPCPLPFGAPDGGQTDIFLLVCCQDDRMHLHVLARVCVLCLQTGLLTGLRTATSEQEMLDAVRAAEQAVIAAQPA